MKKLFLLLIGIMGIVHTASAQFEQDKLYVGASLTGLNLGYNGKDGLEFGADAKAGYFFTDDWLLLGQFSYNHSGNEAVADHITVGAGLRYYIIQNGLYLGVNGKLLHAYHNYNDLMPGVEIGYAFFLSGTATIEPSIFYDQSFRNHKDYSTLGFKIGFGLYF